MPRKTSFYLSDEDDALLRQALASGVTLKEVMRRGIGAAAPDAAFAREAASEAVEAMEERLRGLVREIVQETVREALNQGGGYR